MRTFSSFTIAIHLAIKPLFHMTIPETSEMFGLPDLHNALCAYLDHCLNGEHYDVSTERMQIWSKIQVQLCTWHIPESVKPAQSLIIVPPSPQHPFSHYGCTIISPMADSNWPAGSLCYHFIALPLLLTVYFKTMSAFCCPTLAYFPFAWYRHFPGICSMFCYHHYNGPWIRHANPQMCVEKGWFMHW